MDRVYEYSVGGGYYKKNRLNNDKSTKVKIQNIIDYVHKRYKWLIKSGTNLSRIINSQKNTQKTLTSASHSFSPHS